MKGILPVNSLRNAALLAANTPLVLVGDGQLLCVFSNIVSLVAVSLTGGFTY